MIGQLLDPIKMIHPMMKVPVLVVQALLRLCSLVVWVPHVLFLPLDKSQLLTAQLWPPDRHLLLHHPLCQPQKPRLHHLWQIQELHHHHLCRLWVLLLLPLCLEWEVLQVVLPHPLQCQPQL